MARKSPKDYAREAADKKFKVRECRRCRATIWGGHDEASWVFLDMVNLTPVEEARFIAAGVATWDVRFVGREWIADYRTEWHLDQERRRGSRHIVYPSHICRNNGR